MKKSTAKKPAILNVLHAPEKDNRKVWVVTAVAGAKGKGGTLGEFLATPRPGESIRGALLRARHQLLGQEFRAVAVTGNSPVNLTN
jgi:hypothetical protein